MNRSLVFCGALAFAACQGAQSTAPAVTTATTSTVAATTTTTTTLPAATASPFEPPDGSPGPMSPLGGPAAASPGEAAPAASAPPDTTGGSPAPNAAAQKVDPMLKVQAALDRARFPPGEIDGRDGSNTRLALAAYAKANGLAGADAARAALLRDATPALVSYEITPQDVAGPFVEVPEDMDAKAKLSSLGYASLAEALGEKFHASPALLKQLNFGAAFKAGETIQAPNVQRAPPAKAASVQVDKSDRSVVALDDQGKVIARYPATMGSVHDPLPLGKWKIIGVQQNPKFRYDPDLFWNADVKDEKATIQSGPNNPVGVVWMDLSKPHYGIHGTPEPAMIGKTQSHGCIRLTNWDAEELSGMVKAGTPAILEN